MAYCIGYRTGIYTQLGSWKIQVNKLITHEFAAVALLSRKLEI